MPLQKKGHLVVWSDNVQLAVGSIILIEIRQQSYTCKVVGIVQQGGSFVICHLRALGLGQGSENVWKRSPTGEDRRTHAERRTYAERRTHADLKIINGIE